MISPQCEDQNSIICLCHGPGFWPNILIIFLDRVAVWWKSSSYPHEKGATVRGGLYSKEKILMVFFLFFSAILLFFFFFIFSSMQNTVMHTQCFSLAFQPCPLQFRLQDQKLSIIVSHLKNLCELIEPCSPDTEFHFNIQITKLS